MVFVTQHELTNTVGKQVSPYKEEDWIIPTTQVWWLKCRIPFEIHLEFTCDCEFKFAPWTHFTVWSFDSSLPPTRDHRQAHIWGVDLGVLSEQGLSGSPLFLQALNVPRIILKDDLLSYLLFFCLLATCKIYFSSSWHWQKATFFANLGCDKACRKRFLIHSANQMFRNLLVSK